MNSSMETVCLLLRLMLAEDATLKIALQADLIYCTKRLTIMQTDYVRSSKQDMWTGLFSEAVIMFSYLVIYHWDNNRSQIRSINDKTDVLNWY